MKFLCVLTFAFCSLTFGQQQSGIQAESSGTCSPNILSTQGTVQFTCNAALDKLTAAKIVSLLNEILRDEGRSRNSAGDSSQKLDEMLALLKSPPPIERSEQFAVMVPFDTVPGGSPIPYDENPDDPLEYTYWDLSSLATNGTVPASARGTTETGQTTWQPEPVTTAEAPAFLGRLLQYYILKSIDGMERNSIIAFVGYPAEARAGIEPPDKVRYSHEKLFADLANNRFFKPFQYRKSGDEMSWELGGIPIPKGTEIKLMEEAVSSPRYIVRLERPGYFKIEYVVENFSGTGPPSVPKHFVTARASTTMQWAFFVTMRYEIRRRAEEEFHPDRYVQWADALYAGLQEKLDESKVPTHSGRVR